MALRMIQTLSTKQQLKQEQELRQEQRLAQIQQQKLEMRQAHQLKQRLLQKMALDISTNRVDIDRSPYEMAKTVIGKIIESSREELGPLFESLFGEPKTTEMVVQNNFPLIRGLNRDYNDFTLRYLFNTQTDYNGEFQIEEPGEEGMTRGVKIPFATFADAANKPERMKKERDILVEVMKKNPQGGSMMQVREIDNAFRVLENLTDARACVNVAIRLILQHEIDGEAILYSLLQDTYLLSILDYTLSDRCLKRMASTFVKRRIDGSSRSEDFENGTLNGIAEYTLIILGVISPEIFGSHRKEISEYAKDAIKVENPGISIDEILARLNMENKSEIFWNRYKTVNTQPTYLTEEKIRDFITRTVRAEKETIMKEIRFDVWFRNTTHEFMKMKDEERREEGAKEHFFYQQCAKLLQSDYLNKVLVRLIKTKWQDHLMEFYRDNREEG